LLYSSNKCASELLSGVDNDAEQENAETKDTKQEDGATLTLGAALTLELLSDHDGWPKWLIDGIDHLQSISCAESCQLSWITLLAGIVKLKQSLGFPSAVSKCDIVLKAD
jgi:hypothetical protein